MDRMMRSCSEDLSDYIDQLELERDRLLLKCAQLMLELEQKDMLIKRIAQINDKWYDEIKACVRGMMGNE